MGQTPGRNYTRFKFKLFQSKIYKLLPIYMLILSLRLFWSFIIKTPNLVTTDNKTDARKYCYMNPIPGKIIKANMI